MSRSIDIDPYALPSYRLEWRSDLTTSWVLVEELDENPGDLSGYIEARRAGLSDHWSRSGQWRVITQHVIGATGLGAESFPNPH